MSHSYEGRLARTIYVSSGLLALVVGGCTAPAPSSTTYPTTETRRVIDTYHGVDVPDDYRWLENGSDPAVTAWAQAQNAYTRAALDKLPHREAIRVRLTELSRSSKTYDRLLPAGSGWLAIKRGSTQPQPTLSYLTTLDDAQGERTVLDPMTLDAGGGVSIDWYVPSRDGTRVAVSLSRGGSESGDVHVFDVATGRPLGDIVPRVNGGTAGGSLTWAADGSGFYYSRYPRAGERPAEDLGFYTQVFFHTIGTDTATDRYEIGKEFPRIAEIFLRTSQDGRHVVANVANGDGGQFAQFLRTAEGRWVALTSFEDGAVFATFGPDATLYMLSRRGAPHGQVLRLSLKAPSPRLADATVFIPESADSAIAFWPFGVDPIVVTPGAVVVLDVAGGPNRLRQFDPNGHLVRVLPLPEASTVSDIVAAPSRELLVQASSYIQPPTWRAFGVERKADGVIKTALSSAIPEAFSDMEVVRMSATSKDGTSVPISIVRRKGIVLDGSHPVLLTGYGGYGVNFSPYFDAGLSVWLDQGGVAAFANLRGGGEFGEAWHEAGRLTRKQNVFDDFLAVAEQVIRAGYTTPERLAILGGSNGGLLVAAAMTQRPDLFRAVVSFVGIYDMLRYELSTNGAFNVPEFGTVKDAEQFRAIYAYSPYHRVVSGAAYPATLLLTGLNDPRVEPMHSFKMAARLQAAAGPGRRVLLRVSDNSGHGSGTALDEQIGQQADGYAFLFDALELGYQRGR